MENKMSLLVTLPDGYTKNKFITNEAKELLSSNFNVTWNTTGSCYSKEELSAIAGNFDIILTGWGTPSLIGSDAIKSGKIKMIAHTAGSVADLIDDEAYQNGIKVLSGNRLFAESVAEGTIAYILSALRYLPDEIYGMKNGMQWKTTGFRETRSLLYKTVGIVGYGMISKHLMRLLKPFSVKIKVFSRHPMDMDFLKDMNAEPATLDDIFSTCPIVTLHSSLTPSTHDMITGEHFKKMLPDSVFINTARGAIINEEEMTAALTERKDIIAVLDVFKTEPLEADSPLRKLGNVYLVPHKGGPTVDSWGYIGYEVISDIIRFSKGKPLLYEITRETAGRMTKQH